MSYIQLPYGYVESNKQVQFSLLSNLVKFRISRGEIRQLKMI